MRIPERELVCYWMRGLPCCGKTETALGLIGDTEGIICDPYQWFKDHSERFRHYRYTKAKRWAWYRCLSAARQSITPIVMDMHVGINKQSRRALRELETLGYRVELVEPDSDDWQLIKGLIYNRLLNKESLNKWAETLAKRSPYHQYHEIRTRMNTWAFDTLDSWR